MEEWNKNRKSWSIGTFIRILPNVKNVKTVIEYAHEGDEQFICPTSFFQA